MSLKFHRWLHKNKLSRKHLKTSRWSKWLGDWIHAREYWTPTPESLARGWLIGCVSGGSPFWGFQILLGLPFAVVFRANLPMMLFLVLLTNPFTIPFYFAVAYVLGKFLLSGRVDASEGPPEAALAEPPALSLATLFSEGFMALFVGCMTIGITLGVGGYFLIRYGWKPKTRGARKHSATRIAAPAPEQAGRSK